MFTETRIPAKEAAGTSVRAAVTRTLRIKLENFIYLPRETALSQWMAAASKIQQTHSMRPVVVHFHQNTQLSGKFSYLLRYGVSHYNDRDIHTGNVFDSNRPSASMIAAGSSTLKDRD